MRPWTASASVTAGLKWAPEIGPKARISATSAAPVASVFASKRDRDVASGETLSHDARADHGREQQRRADRLRRDAP